MAVTILLSRTIAAGAVLLGASASAQGCLDTLFASNGGGLNGGAVYFDITVSTPGGILVTTLQTNTGSLAPFNMDVYTTPGTYAGVVGAPGAWTLVSTGSGIGLGLDARTVVDVVDFPLLPGSYGLALVMDAAAGHRYTNGPLGPYSDASISLTLGAAGNIPFTAPPFTPRIWNGQVCYDPLGPLCAISSPMPLAAVTGEVTMDVDIDHRLMIAVDAAFDYSTDRGMTWTPCSAGMGYSNPILGLATPAPGTLFGWNSLADGVGLLTPEIALFRVTVGDSGGLSRSCSVDVTVDNGGGLCGDCNGDGVLSVLDALVAAQSATGLMIVTGTQFESCNVNGVPGPETAPGATVDVLDALELAQAAAGLPVMLNCNTLPTCVVTSPLGGTQVGDVDIVFDAADAQGDPLTIIFEFDGGAGFLPATAAATSPLANPALGVAPAAGLQFTWDSATDLPLTIPGVRFRITVDDGIGLVTGCSSIFDVGNP